MPALKRKLAGLRSYFGLPDNSWSMNHISNFVLHYCMRG